MRINKYLSAKGVCSRREADRLLEAGRITVDGAVAECGQQVDDNNIICIDGSKISNDKPEDILIAFNKPVGIVCTTTNKQGNNNIVDYINYPIRIYPIGRLDKDSQGLILLTNEGDLVNKIMRSRNQHEKEYIVKVDKVVNQQFIDHMKNGVEILGAVTKPCKAYQTGPKEFDIILTQGLNRQIRRMCEKLGYNVTSLTRIRIINIKLGDLQPGKIRKINEKELEDLKKMLEHSE